MILAFTGHRPDKLGGYSEANPLRVKIGYEIMKHLYATKPTEAISGMALGVDQWAAISCIVLGIPFTAAIPFAGQELTWPPASRDQYDYLIKKAARVEIVSSGGYAASKMQRRNEWMVDRCDRLLAVYDGSAGGTANCIGYALAKKKLITYIRISRGAVVDPLP